MIRILVGWMFAWLFAAQTTGSLTGQVTEQESGAPVPDVAVVAALGEHEPGDVTADDGSYHLTGLLPGSYHVTFFAGAKRVVRDDVRIQAGRETKLSVKLLEGPPYRRVNMDASVEEIRRCEEEVPPAALRDRPL